MSSLTQSMSHLEDSVRQLEQEKQSLLQDVSAVRDLCAQLEATKEALQRQLTNKTLDHDKVRPLDNLCVLLLIATQVRQINRYSVNYSKPKIFLL